METGEIEPGRIEVGIAGDVPSPGERYLLGCILRGAGQCGRSYARRCGYRQRHYVTKGEATLIIGWNNTIEICLEGIQKRVYVWSTEYGVLVARRE